MGDGGRLKGETIKIDVLKCLKKASKMTRVRKYSVSMNRNLNWTLSFSASLRTNLPRGIFKAQISTPTTTDVSNTVTRLQESKSVSCFCTVACNEPWISLKIAKELGRADVRVGKMFAVRGSH